MPVINPYLNFMGKTEEAFNFYRSVLGGEFEMLQRFKDTPAGDQVAPEERDLIMHVGLPIGNNVLMGTDCLVSMGQNVSFGNNVSITICPDSLEQANQFFNGLSAGGEVKMPLEKQFWGAYFGYFFDKFGVQWMVNYQFEQPK